MICLTVSVIFGKKISFEAVKAVKIVIQFSHCQIITIFLQFWQFLTSKLDY